VRNHDWPFIVIAGLIILFIVLGLAFLIGVDLSRPERYIEGSLSVCDGYWRVEHLEGFEDGSYTLRVWCDV
jgi:hypothetical protein